MVNTYPTTTVVGDFQNKYTNGRPLIAIHEFSPHNNNAHKNKTVVTASAFKSALRLIENEVCITTCDFAGVVSGVADGFGLGWCTV